MTPLASIEKRTAVRSASGALQHDRIVVDDLDGRVELLDLYDTGTGSRPIAMKW